MAGKIGKYELGPQVRFGGMGEVFRSYDPTVCRFVAIKILNVDSDASLLRRFNREATAAGNLNHPHIVTIHDYGEHEGRPYLVMEFLEGEDLQTALEQGRRFELEEAATIMSQVADGLECAHQHGVIHRDVKPANIMLLQKGGGVKLLGFGIARRSGHSTQPTSPAQILGSALYMSPEHFQNAELDAGVDVWAYGIIYYRLLTGRHPFEAPDPQTTVDRILNSDPAPIRSLNPDVPEALAQIVSKCLVKLRDLRYRGMEDVRFDSLPVLREFDHRRAARMVIEARKLSAQGDFAGAQEMVRRSLEINPGERSAHDLRKEIADEIHSLAVRAQVERLCAEAEAHMSEQRPAEAVAKWDEAARLDPLAAVARQRAGEGRALILRLQQEAIRRQETIVTARAAAFQQFTAHVNWLIGEHRFEEALTLLEVRRDDFAANPRAKPAFASLTDAAMAARAAFARQARLEESLRAVEALRLSGDLSGAHRSVDLALGDFGPDTQLSQLRDRIADEQARLARADEYIARAYAAIGRREFKLAEKLLGAARKLGAPRESLIEAERELKKEHEAFPGAARRKLAAKVIGIALAAVALFMALQYFSRRPAAPAVLKLFPQSADFVFVLGGKPPDSMRVRVSGEEGTSFSAATTASWIEVTPDSGTLPATVRITAKPAMYPVGRRDGFIDFTAGSMVARLPVGLTILRRSR